MLAFLITIALLCLATGVVLVYTKYQDKALFTVGALCLVWSGALIMGIVALLIGG